MGEMNFLGTGWRVVLVVVGLAAGACGGGFTQEEVDGLVAEAVEQAAETTTTAALTTATTVAPTTTTTTIDPAIEAERLHREESKVLGVEIDGVVADLPEEFRMRFNRRPIGNTYLAPDVLRAVLATLPDPTTEDDVLVSLAAIYEAAVEAGMPPDKEDFGLERFLRIRLQEWAGPLGTPLRDGFAGYHMEIGRPAIWFAVWEATLAIEDPHADPIATMTALQAAAVAAGMDPENDLGLAEVTNLIEEEIEDAAELAELASRPRVEVLTVEVRPEEFGQAVFWVTFRNNYTSPVIGVDFRLYAYNVFGDGLGGECGRFPTYYEGSNSSRAVNGDTFIWVPEGLCLDTAETATVTIRRMLFEDGTVWSP